MTSKIEQFFRSHANKVYVVFYENEIQEVVLKAGTPASHQSLDGKVLIFSDPQPAEVFMKTVFADEIREMTIMEAIVSSWIEMKMVCFCDGKEVMSVVDKEVEIAAMLSAKYIQRIQAVELGRLPSIKELVASSGSSPMELLYKGE